MANPRFEESPRMMASSSVLIPSPSASKAKFRHSKFPIAGIRLGHLRRLDINKEMTIYDVCKRYIRPWTSHIKNSYVEYLRVSETHMTEKLVKDKAEIFISYAWGYTWGLLIEALSSLHNDTYVWIDLFVVNQHMVTESELMSWLETFSGAIQAIGKVVVILAPWRCPVPVTRAWCVFEILTALETNVERQILVPRSELEDLVACVKRGEFAGRETLTPLDLLRDINVMRAEACKREDKEVILKRIKQRGIIDVNNVVLLPIKMWYLRAVETTITDNHTKPGTLERGNAYSSLYALLEMLGRPTEALEAALLCLDCYRRCSASPFKLMLALRQVGNAYAAVGDWERAEANLKRSLETVHCNPNTTDESDLIMLQREYSTAKAQMGDPIDALELAKQAYVNAIRLFGHGDRRFGDCATNYGAILRQVGRREEAKKMFEEALRAYEEGLGEDHPRVGMARINLALTLNAENKPDEAMEQCEKAKFIVERTLGRDHLEMATVQHNRAVSALRSSSPSNTKLDSPPNEANVPRESNKNDDVGEQGVAADEGETCTFSLASKEEKERIAFEAADRAVEVWSEFLGDKHPTTLAAKKFWNSQKHGRGMDDASSKSYSQSASNSPENPCHADNTLRSNPENGAVNLSGGSTKNVPPGNGNRESA